MKRVAQLVDSQGMQSMTYTLLFQDFIGRIYSSAQLEAQSDGEAIALARRIYSSGIGRCYEIICGDRHVHVEESRSPNFGLYHQHTVGGR